MKIINIAVVILLPTEILKYYNSMIMEPTTQKQKTTPKDFFLNLSVKLSKVYLFIVGMSYIVSNLLFLLGEGVIGILGLQFLLIIPQVTISWNVSTSFTNAPIILAMFLQGFYIIIGLSVIIALKLAKRSPGWIYLLYVVVTLGLVGSVYDLVLLPTTKSYLFGTISLINTAIIFLATRLFISRVRIITPKMRPIGRYFALTGGVLVVATIAVGFSVIGSPATRSALGFDVERTNDLMKIQWQVENHWQQNEKLPETLDQLRDPIGSFVLPTDPVAGEAYGYEVMGETSYKLCATFYKSSQPVPMRAIGENW